MTLRRLSRAFCGLRLPDVLNNAGAEQMGTWGLGIFSDDTAADIRSASASDHVARASLVASGPGMPSPIRSR